MNNQVISLGGGKASTSLFLRSLHGEIENPAELAVFADTGAEPQTTYNTIQYLQEYAKQFNVPVHIIKAEGKNIVDQELDTTTNNGGMPLFTYNEKGEKMMLRKFCSGHFKRDPLRKYTKNYFNATHKNPMHVWLGYTVDEAFRMKPSKMKYEQFRYPLIEKRLDRYECEKYLEKYGFDFVERSACLFCPYRRDEEWKILTEEELVFVEKFEKELNETYCTSEDSKFKVLRFHKSLDPITDRPFENPQPNLFDPIDDICGGASCFT